MRFFSLKFQNLVRKIDLVNRRWVFYSRAYGIYNFSLSRLIGITVGFTQKTLLVNKSLVFSSRAWNLNL